MHFATLLIVGAAAAALSSCAAPLNFDQPGGPRWSAHLASENALRGPVADSRPTVAPSPPPELRVVTFNIKYSRGISKAIRLLQEHPALHPADLVLLQEMDPDGVRRVAGALGMGFVYYPANVHPGTGRLFGNAILSRWPLSDDRKLVLPHLSRFGRTRRIAVAATMDVAGLPIRVYSVHIATPVQVSLGGRRDQVRALLDDADGPYDRVIVGGDLNAKGLGKLFAERGYAWPSEDLGWTTAFSATDHIFLRGVGSAPEHGVGKVADNLGASDHLPVWAVVTLPPARPVSGH
jgi:endonuclease/exonuclease/phosphatase family metal-dependent hydrolase